MRKIIIPAMLAAALAVPAVAQAGLSDQLNASDQVERVASHRYHFEAISTCRQIGARKFTCTVVGSKGDCFYRGRANVRKLSSYTYKVTTMHVSKDCF